ncbi:MAG TPA: two-component regulator propeller domain-containing protein, partial [Blastocatellia bacterium]|nr:two-component regulator propeller domain-containing protein [Blastocatellia bacterium]
MAFWPFVLILLYLNTPAASPPPDDAVTYSRRVWRSVDGLPEDFAQSVAQTPDGYVWIGTSAGLVRFDGARFVVFSRENAPALADDSIYCLLVSRDGTLWAGTEGGGLVRYKNGLFRSYGESDGLTNAFVRVIFEDKNGTIWVGTDAGLFQLRAETLTRIDGRGSTPQMNVHAICETRDGRLLVGGWGLLVLNGNRSDYYSSSESLADNSIRTMCQTADGAIWIGTVSGLRKIETGVGGNPFTVRKTLSGINISVLLESRRAQLWIATYGQGLFRYEKGRIVSFS